MGKRRLAMVISLLFIAISIGSILVRGLNLGVDFTGGTLVEVGYPETVELEPIRQSLITAGFNEAIVQHFGTARDVLIRLPSDASGDADQMSLNVMSALSGTGNPSMRRVEFVGPQVGEELRDDGGLAVLYSLVGILIYVALRFEYRFSIGSVVALVHDVIITVGFFSLFQIDFDLTVLAAVLAVIGYSLNDTIVVFDRIRENFRKMRKSEAEQVINISINQTLSRTIMTGVTTLLVLGALFFLGGEVIHSFSIALIVGIVVGTYSSIYIASATLLLLNVSKADLMPVARDDAELNKLP